MIDAADDAYTGFVTRLSPVFRKAHDPEIALWGGTIPPWGPRAGELSLGGAGWDEDSARNACIGEAVERLQAYPLPDDAGLDASLSEWALDEPAIGPERWVMFHPDQHRQPEFPFKPFSRTRSVRWTCFREAFTGRPAWIPDEFGYLFHASAARAPLAPSTSTGLACGRADAPVLLRGVQEVVERDGVVGAWWGAYALEEWDPAAVLGALGPDVADRIRRPNRRYRFYRVRSPFSDHVTVATAEGEDRGGFLFAAGSACRETRTGSWLKAILEAVQGLAYVRQLRDEHDGLEWVTGLTDFSHHAAYYSAHPEQLKSTVLHSACAPEGGSAEGESTASIRNRLGTEHPILFRIMSPTVILPAVADWIVLRVVIPGLQPLHGNHRWPHLGGRLWDRPVSGWDRMAPHPFA